MNKEQIQLVKQSWKLLRNIDPAIVGDLFYSKLFADNPQVKKCFPKTWKSSIKN
jgi:hemoglobin-like flavoprotein